MEIEVQGGTKVKEKYPDTVMIFIVPPDMETLKQRLHGRGTEADDVIEKRIKRAYEEFDYLEKYDYIVVNDDIEKAAQRIKAIICAEQQKRSRVFEDVRKEVENMIYPPLSALASKQAADTRLLLPPQKEHARLQTARNLLLTAAQKPLQLL